MILSEKSSNFSVSCSSGRPRSGTNLEPSIGVQPGRHRAAHRIVHGLQKLAAGDSLTAGLFAAIFIARRRVPRLLRVSGTRGRASTSPVDRVSPSEGKGLRPRALPAVGATLVVARHQAPILNRPSRSSRGDHKGRPTGSSNIIRISTGSYAGCGRSPKERSDPRSCRCQRALLRSDLKPLCRQTPY